ncbi:MAG: hypothetical protein LH660_04955 [Phormidesmis sp. CAN_BIN36]|nr:hypothetical protein [Phormidesmis sp. CAN_BIN36]
MSNYSKALIQVWFIIALGGVIGLAAMNWNNYEKGSALAALHEVSDLIKTQITKHQEVKR